MQRADMPGRKAVLDRLAGWLDKRGVRYAGALGFENAYAFAMRRDRAKALGIETLADLAAYAPRLKIGGDFEIFSRPEWNAVVKTLWRAFRRSAPIPGEFHVQRADGRRRRRDLGILERTGASRNTG